MFLSAEHPPLPAFAGIPGFLLWPCKNGPWLDAFTDHGCTHQAAKMKHLTAQSTGYQHPLGGKSEFGIKGGYLPTAEVTVLRGASPKRWFQNALGWCCLGCAKKECRGNRGTPQLYLWGLDTLENSLSRSKRKFSLSEIQRQGSADQLTLGFSSS